MAEERSTGVSEAVDDGRKYFLPERLITKRDKIVALLREGKTAAEIGFAVPGLAVSELLSMMVAEYHKED